MTITDKAWTCDIHNAGCLTNAHTSWTCKVEGIQISACESCWVTWRGLVATDPSLQNRCPKCVKALTRVPAALRIAAGKGGTSVPSATEPLRGVIADAIDTAMHKEGVLADVRRKVLLRLATEEPWLNFQLSTPKAG